MTPDTVNDRCARCSQSEDDLLMDAENAAKALMLDAAETVALRARVKELEEALTELFSWGARGHDHRDIAPWSNASRVLLNNRPTPSQERP